VVKRQLVVFKIGSEEFAIDILLTKEVVVMREVTSVPETEDYVEGVMNLRGNLVPVIDLRKRLRACGTNAEEEQRIIVVQLDRRVVGLIVDGASEVIRVNDTQIEPAPDIITELGIGYVLGVINFAGRYITLIDLDKALSGEITNELAEVMNVLERTATTEKEAASVESQTKQGRRGTRQKLSR